MASKAVYNPRPWSMPKAATVGSTESTSQEDGFLFSDDFNDFEEEEPERLPLIKTQPRMRQMISMPTQGEEAISSLKVSREHKELFTVVRNVKQAHECQEHGETQEFKDDIEYIMDGLHDTNNTSIRCLSTLSLASKCTMPAFRMHLRAHGTLTKIFSALHDAPSYPTLALCSAAVMFMMSRDRLTMDIEKQGLELMLRLMSMDAESLAQNDHGTRTEYARNKKKIQEICEELKKVGGVKDFDFDEITTGYLAMETLLSLTSKRAGDWFKEEMRTLGGLDHIINSIFQSTEELEDDSIELTPDTVNRLKNIERCLRVLENVTYLNSDNQSHLISYKSSVLITSICRTLRICENCLPYNAAVCKDSDTVDKESPGYAVFSCLLAILRVLLNLTHDNELGSIRVGQVKGFMTTALVVILQIPQYVPVDQRFDILVLGLGLLINMVEHCDSNRQLLIATQTVSPYESLSQNSMEETDSLVALVQLFTIRAQAARRAEEEHDAELEKSQEAKESNGDQEEKPNDVSGQWKESESGLEWVVIPMEDGEEVADGDDAVSNASTDIEVIQGSQEEDENFTKALHRMGKHMEDSIVAAYVALLVGCLVQEGRDYVDIVRDCLPEHNFETMIRMLKKFLGFMNLTSGGSNTGAKSIKNVIEILEAC